MIFVVIIGVAEVEMKKEKGMAEGNHSHNHVHTNTKAVLNRLSRTIGHLEAVKRMVEDGRDCSEVLIQLSAVKSAINNFASANKIPIHI